VAQTTPTNRQTSGSLQESTWKVLNLMAGYVLVVCLLLLYTSKYGYTKCCIYIVFNPNRIVYQVFTFGWIVHSNYTDYRQPVMTCRAASNAELWHVKLWHDSCTMCTMLRQCCWHLTLSSGWPLVWKTWKCPGIWQLSGKCQRFYWKSGKCQRKIHARRKLPKTVYCKLHICVHTGI